MYKAEDTRLERTVALKVLAAHLLTDEEAKRRFEREANAAAGLDNPNIATVFEVGEDSGQCVGSSIDLLAIRPRPSLQARRRLRRAGPLRPRGRTLRERESVRF